MLDVCCSGAGFVGSSLNVLFDVFPVAFGDAAGSARLNSNQVI